MSNESNQIGKVLNSDRGLDMPESAGYIFEFGPGSAYVWFNLLDPKKFRQINECQKIQLLRTIHAGFEKVWGDLSEKKFCDVRTDVQTNIWTDRRNGRNSYLD